jgi:hypothetical protein
MGTTKILVKGAAILIHMFRSVRTDMNEYSKIEINNSSQVKKYELVSAHYYASKVF